MLSSVLHQQRGAALIIGLILIMVGSIGAIAIMRGNHVHDRMASNHHNKIISQMAAEAGASRFIAWVSDPARGSDLSADWNQTGTRDEFPNLPTSGSIQFPPYGYYYIPAATYPTWSGNIGTVSVVGTARVDNQILAETHLRLSVLRNPASPGGSLFSGGSPPAAISCLGGPCSLSAGTGNNAKIDGQDHRLPTSNCNGNSCWMDPIPSSTPFPERQNPLPSVFLEVSTGSTVSAGNKKEPYCGASRLSPSTVVCGGDANASSVWNPTSYPPDASGNATAPTRTGIFGEGTPLYSVVGSAAWGTREEPKITIASATSIPASMPGNANTAGVLIIDGTDFSRQGTGIFAGLVVIKNCGTLSMGGNFNLYGAVLIDAAGCSPTYNPFSGGGTPSIRYSADALKLASGAAGGGSPGGNGGGFSVTTWTEVFPSG